MAKYFNGPGNGQSATAASAEAEPRSLAFNDQEPATIDASPSDKLQKETVGCRLRLQRLSVSRGFDATVKANVAAHLGITKTRAVSGGYRIYDDSHPVVKAHNELFSRVENYWKGETLPLSAIYSDESGVEGGTRLLRKDKAEQFHARMLAFKSEVETLAHKFDENRETILLAAQEMLGPKFDPKNYPEKVSLGVFWGFPNIEIPSYLASMAPKAYEHERKLVAKRFEDTYEMATVAMFEELHAVMRSWAQALRPVTIVRPPAGNPHRDRYDAEVLKNEIGSDGKVTVTLRCANDDGKGTHEVVLPPMTEAAYKEMQPLVSNDRKRRFHNTTIDNLKEIVAKFKLLGSLVHTTADMDKNLAQMEALLVRFSGADELAEELRSSKTFRADTQKWAEALTGDIEKQIETFTVSRRKITRASNIVI